MFSQMSTAELQFGDPTLGQYPSYSDPSSDVWSTSEVEFSDLLLSTWPKHAYPTSSTAWSPGAFHSTFLQDSPFGDSLEKSLEGCFSSCDLSDIPCLDLSQALSDPDDIFIFGGAGDASQLYFEPSQLQRAGPAIEADEQFLQSVSTSSPEPEPCEKKTYTPAWKPKSQAQIQTRSRKAAKKSKIANPKPSKSSPATSELDSGAGCNSKLRANHNLTEKLYRNRLNGQFETLLSALPPAHDASEVRNGDEKRVSKAEVLILAKEHIRALEQTRLVLERERSGLSNNVESLKGMWVGMNAELS